MCWEKKKRKKKYNWPSPAYDLGSLELVEHYGPVICGQAYGMSRVNEAPLSRVIGGQIPQEESE